MHDTTNDLLHKPVMVEEVLDYLNPQTGQVIIDCTVGGGGHASKIMSKIKVKMTFLIKIKMSRLIILIIFSPGSLPGKLYINILMKRLDG